jgi:hypothetical protein
LETFVYPYMTEGSTSIDTSKLLHDESINDNTYRNTVSTREAFNEPHTSEVISAYFNI